jgi:ABC-type protease/lipase transport system fused ATPase/permease subunit
MATTGTQGGRGIGAALAEGRSALISTGVFSFITNLLMLTGPLFMLQVYDRVLTSGSVPTLVALVALIAILYALYGFLEFIRARLMMRVGRLADENLRHRAFDIVQWHALQGDPQLRLGPISDMITLRQFLAGPGPFAFFDMPWAPVYLAVIYMLHPVLGMASTVAVVLLAALAFFNNRLIRVPTAEAHKATMAAQAMSEQALRNAEVARVMGMTSALRSRWAAQQQEALEAQTLATDRGGFSSATLKHAAADVPVRHPCIGGMACHSPGDFTRLDDCCIHHHVACACAGGAGGGSLAAVSQFPVCLAAAHHADDENT